MLSPATGQDPFEGESLGGVTHRVLSSDPDLSALPGSLRGLVGAALDKDPAARSTTRQLLPAMTARPAGSPVLSQRPGRRPLRNRSTKSWWSVLACAP
ncbi:hypothetical protein ACIBLB_32355 [Streptosporangium canum]|uniref:hypothetical protein n=1 Tax=Streptosporangium canum TaxID=324952 RepID=UPI003787CA80